MALSPLRRRLNAGFGLLVLASALWLLWPLAWRPVALWAFCTNLTVGSLDDTMRTRAGDEGFKVSPLVGGVAHVYDLASLGKFSCTVRVQGGRLRSASFAYGSQSTDR